MVRRTNGTRKMKDYNEIRVNLRSLVNDASTNEQWQAVQKSIEIINKIEQGKLIELPMMVAVETKWYIVDNIGGDLVFIGCESKEEAEEKLEELNNARDFI